MKKLISLFLAVLLAFSCFALAGSAFWGGAMLEYTAGTYNAGDYLTKYVPIKCVYKSSDGDGDSVSTSSYDENGNVVKSTYKSGNITSTTTYTYDANGNITKRAFKNSRGYSETETFTYSGGKLKKQTFKTVEGESSYVGTMTYSYNSSGFLSKKAYSNPDGSYSYSYSYSYDSAGNILKIVYKVPGAKSTTTTYTYNSRNLLTKEVNKYDGGSSTTTYKYDKKDNVIKTVCDSSDDYSDYTNTCTYDDNGNVLTNKTVMGTGETYTTTRTYDAKGRLTKEVYKSSDGYSYTWKTVYDKNGNVSKETFKNSEGESVSTYSYKKLTKAIVKADQIKLEYASTAYDGKAKKPAVFVNGACNGADYRLEYSNNKNPGIASVKIIFTSPELGSITVNFNIKPAKPTNLKITAKTKSSLTLTWGKVTGAKKYIVYKYNTAKDAYTKLAAVTSNKATLKNLKSATTYKLCVVAVANGGVTSAYSGKIAAKTAS